MNRVDLAADEARRLVAALSDLDIDAPAATVKALQRLDAIDAIKPTTSFEAIVDAYLEGNVKKADEASVRHDLAATRGKAWREARVIGGANALETLLNAHVELIEAMRERAEALIATITPLAALDGDTARLVRDGRIDDAKAVAELPLSADELSKLYGLARRLGRNAKWTVNRDLDCSMWRDPRPLGDMFVRSAPTDPTDLFRRGIQAGAVLWWPLPAQARSQSEIYEGERKAVILSDLSDMASRGQLSGFGTPVLN